MVKPTFLYNQPSDREAFDAYFFNQHLPLLAGISNLKWKEIAKVVGTPDGSPAPFHVIAEYYFDSMEALMEDFQSEGGAALNRDLPNFASAGFSAFISQVEAD